LAMTPMRYPPFEGYTGPFFPRASDRGLSVMLSPNETLPALELLATPYQVGLSTLWNAPASRPLCANLRRANSRRFRFAKCR
jgi:hypothetical protein